MKTSARQARRTEGAESQTGRGGSARLPARRYGLDFADSRPALIVGAANDPAEREADIMAEQALAGYPVSRPTRAATGVHRACAACADEEQGKLHRKADGGGDPHGGRPAPGLVSSLLSEPGRTLDPAARRFFEGRFASSFADVAVHDGPAADRASRSIGARAFTAGSHIAFARGEYQPGTREGMHLLAHELAHTRQQRGTHSHVRRTPARQVSCANNLPLRVPGQADVPDPVGVITAAENRATQMMDDVINELEFTRQRILGGAPVGWPTISDSIAQGLRLMGLDPDDAAVWTAPTGTGTRSVPLLIRRLRLIRGTIGAGSFFFFCLGTGMRRLGNCVPPAGDPDICTNAEAATCAGEFFTAFCPDFWSQSAELRASTIIHESAHNFANFIGHTGRFTNAECFARLVQEFAGVPVADQRPDLCPDP